jgi:hypothetical protein
MLHIGSGPRLLKNGLPRERRSGRTISPRIARPSKSTKVRLAELVAA